MTRRPGAGGTVAGWRPLAATDAPALAALHADCRRLDGEADDILGPEALWHSLTIPGTTVEADTLAAFDSRGRLIGYGSVWLRTGVVLLGRAVLAGDVDPSVRGHGIGSRLLDWQVRRARERLRRETPPGLPARMDVFVADDATDRVRLVARSGFRPVRWFATMTCDLAAPAAPGRPLPAGLRDVPWETARSAAVHAAREDGWRDHWGFEPMPTDVWRHLNDENALLLSDASRLAITADGEVAGFVLAEREPDAPLDVATWITQVAVRRAYRGRGIASALLASSLARLRTTGHHTAALTVDLDSPTGAPSLYARQGFAVTHRQTCHGLDLGAGDPPEPSG